MNRRTAMMLTMLLGGLAPLESLGPDQGQAGPRSPGPAPGSRSSPSARPMPTIRMTLATRPDRRRPAGRVRPRVRLSVAHLRHLAVHQGRAGPADPPEGADRVDLPPDGNRRLARREDRRAVRQQDAGPGLQQPRDPQAGGRGRRAVHQRDRGHPGLARPVLRHLRHALAALGLLAAHARWATARKGSRSGRCG